MPKLRKQDEDLRVDFCIDRLKRGFSLLEVQKQFAQRFECQRDNARLWVNKACDTMSYVVDGAETRKRAYRVIIEILHDQIISYQGELLQTQQQIDLIAAKQNRLKADQGDDGDGPLEMTTQMIASIEIKSRIRSRLQAAINDLARIRGFTTNSDWRQAVHVLMDANLLPVEIADNILTHLDEFEKGVVS